MGDATPSTESTPSFLIAPTPWHWRALLGGSVALVGLGGYLARDTIGPRGQGAVGIVCIVGFVALLSANLRVVNWRTVGWGFALQLLLAWFVLRFKVYGLGSIGIRDGFAPGFALFGAIADSVRVFLDFTAGGSEFVFGPLANEDAMKQVLGPGKGFLFAFQALPVIIFVSSFFTVMYYLGVLQWVVRVLARGMVYLMQTSGAESLSAAANVFMGQTEAPLIVKPYVARMTQSELLALMVGGMATISGGLMAVYIQMGADPIGIVATSVMAAPCGLYLSKLLLPELEEPETRGKVTASPPAAHRNVIDAAAAGASDGLYLALNVAAMLIAFLAFLRLIDFLLSMFPSDPAGLTGWLRQSEGWSIGGKLLVVLLGYLVTWLVVRQAWAALPAEWQLSSRPATRIAGHLLGFGLFLLLLHLAILAAPGQLSLSLIFARLFAPLAFLMGVEGDDMFRVADLLGTKLALNEFVAYVDLTQKLRGEISPRAYKLATYALTGFANFSSVGIQLGGIGAMAPERRPDLARLGSRALLVGFLTTVLNAAVAGILLPDDVGE